MTGIDEHGLQVSSQINGIRRLFGRAASQYDAHAVLQQEIGSRMLDRLQYIRHDPACVLDAGCGTGAALPGLRQRWPQARLLALDLAEPMLQLACPPRPFWQKWLDRPAVSPVCADMSRLPLATGSVNMIWSASSLQWCSDLPATFAEFRRVLAPGGLLMFATFGPDTLKELRQSFAQLDGYAHVNTFPDMHDIGDWLMAAGFSAPVVDMEYITLTYATLRDMLREIKQIGANAVTGSRKDGLTGRQYWRQLENLYETHRQQGRLPATWEVVYGHAWRPADRVAGMQPVIWHSRRPDGERA